MSTKTDDVVRTAAEAASHSRAPLIVLEPLARFLDERGLGGGELHATPIGGGHSNITYLLAREDGTELILRRPPRPPIPPSAHDVLREAGLLEALTASPARVPAVLASCADEAVIGSPFYLMERVRGEVITEVMPPGLDAPDARAEVANQLIEALVEIHSVDWRTAGLESFGRPSGYLERQIRRFSGLWETNRTREVPAVDRLGRWLAANRPASSPPTAVVHGDYRLGNAIFAPEQPAQLLAVLDWEMATLGDPLADVGYLCAMWTQADDPHRGAREQLSGVSRAPGFPTRAQLVARYEELSGRAVHAARYYVVLAQWKTIVFMEGNYRRALAGASDDPFVTAFAEEVVQLAEEAEALALGPAEVI